MKKLTSLFIFCLLSGTFFFTGCGNKKQKPMETPQEKIAKAEILTEAPTNPFLAKGDYSVEHFNSAQTNSFSLPVKEQSFQVYANQLKEVLPVILPSMLLNSTSNGYYWLTDLKSAYYINTTNDSFKQVGRISLSGKMSDTLSTRDISAFADTFYTTGAELEKATKNIFGKEYGAKRFNGRFPLVDKNNTLFTFYNQSLIAINLVNSDDPTKGLKISKSLDLSDLIKKDDKVVGLQMSYDGYLILNTEQGHFCVVNRDSLTIKNHLQVIPVQKFFSGVAIDDKNGVYAVSDSLMFKMVWNGTTLSVNESDGAWSCPISFDKNPEIATQGGGLLATPVLMGFGNDPDKLVVICDGAARTNLVAFWRDSIPTNFQQKVGTPSPRVAGMIEVKLGLTSATMPPYVQSYHTLPVLGYGALFVNSINGYPAPVSIPELALQGSILPNAKGVERFQWDYENNEWLSVWANPGMGCSAMQPVVNTNRKLFLLNAFNSDNQEEGWSVKGYDWYSGDYKNQVVFSSFTQYGNGGKGYFQYLPDGDMIFNSIAGTYRLTFGEERGLNQAPRL